PALGVRRVREPAPNLNNFGLAGSLRSRLRGKPEAGGRMFQDVLRELVEHTDGAIASLLMGFDGITVDSYSRARASLNVESVGSEYSVVLGQIKQAAAML